MNQLKQFARKALFGGILVILPIVIIGFFFRWAFGLVTDLIQPLTDFTIRNYQFPELLADLFVIIVVLFICFFVGLVVSTSIGIWLHKHFDKYLVRLAPGYRLVKEIVAQIFGSDEDSPFSKGEVARVRIFGEHNETTVTALVTSRHADGTVTVFVPTGPNPTSGNIYHVPQKHVEFYPEASVERMMKSIIACGAGSDVLFRKSNIPPSSQD